MTATNSWMNAKWRDLNLEDVKQSVDQLSKQCEMLPKQFTELDVYHEMRKILEQVKQALPILSVLFHNSIAPRHWSEIFRLAGKKPINDLSTIHLCDILQPEIMAHAESIIELARSAAQESDIERKIKSITDMWHEQTLTFDEFKQRGVIVLHMSMTTEILELLDESQTQLASMMSSRHVHVFKDFLLSWQEKLSTVRMVLELWITVCNL